MMRTHFSAWFDKYYIVRGYEVNIEGYAGIDLRNWAISGGVEMNTYDGIFSTIELHIGPFHANLSKSIYKSLPPFDVNTFDIFNMVAPPYGYSETKEDVVESHVS